MTELLQSAAQDKKKLKVLKEALKDAKACQQDTEKQLEKLITRNLVLEKEMQEKDNKYIDLYDENNQMHEDMLELQEQLEEAGFLDDALSEGFEDDGGSGGKGGSKIPGKKNAKKVIKTLGKLLKRKKGKEKKKKSKDKEVAEEAEEEQPVDETPPVEQVTIEQPVKVEEPV